MSEINPNWIDCDLTIVPPDQQTGLIEQPPAELLASYADVPWYDEIMANDGTSLMVPRAQWKDRAANVWPHFRGSVVQIYSQGQEGSCVGFSITQGIETTNTRRYGRRHWVSLSGVSLYKRIGRTAASGAYIPDGIREATTSGVLPVDSAENRAAYQHTHPRTGFSRALPSGWQSTGRLFRITKSAKIQGTEMMASALLRGHVVIVGRSRHAIPYVGLTFSGNSPVAAYANSWSQTWGDRGFGYDSERTFGGIVGYVILEVSTRPDLDIPIPA
jgi:hypothetical protein